jgi:glycosyltransferase involved in cell wall biosynthesis
VEVARVIAPRVLVSGLVLDGAFSGALRHNRELLPRLSSRLARHGGRLAVLEPLAGIGMDLPGVERIPSRARGHPVWRRRLEEAPALQEAIDTHGPFDLVHVGHLPTPRGLSIPWSWTIHDLRRASNPVGRRWIRRAVRQAKRILTVGQPVADELMERFGAERVHVIGNGGDHFEPLVRNPLPGGPLVVLGHLDARKNHDVVFRALALDPGLPQLHVFGGGGRERREGLAARALELGVASRVHLHGPLPEVDLPRLFSEAACVVLPSRLEGFGIGLLEAARARVPIAMSDLPAHRWVLGDEVPTFGVDDADGCVAAIRAALAETPHALAKRANEAARWTWDRAADQWFKAWTEPAR